MGAAAYALSLLAELPGLLAAGKEVLGLIGHGREALAKMQMENRGPTEEEKAALNDLIAGLRKELHS